MLRSSNRSYNSYSGRPYYGNAGPGQSYPMNSYANQHGPPVYRPGQENPDVNGPPAYNPADVPPAYVPPPGASKTAPEQIMREQQVESGFEEGSSTMRPPGAVVR